MKPEAMILGFSKFSKKIESKLKFSSLVDLADSLEKVYIEITMQADIAKKKCRIYLLISL